jgi:hypothetical protein
MKELNEKRLNYPDSKKILMPIYETKKHENEESRKSEMKKCLRRGWM